MGGRSVQVDVDGEHVQLLGVGFQSTLTGRIREFRAKDELG